MKSGKGNDAIVLPLTVISSRLQAQTAKSEKLTVDTKVTAINNLPMAVVLTDQGQNILYDPLLKLTWEWGDRLDQKYVRQIGYELLNMYYQEKSPPEETTPSAP